MKLMRRAMPTPRTEEILHSSGLAREQSGANPGATSGETFRERRAVDANRQFVRGYHAGSLMRGVQPGVASAAAPVTTGLAPAGGTASAGGAAGDVTTRPGVRPLMQTPRRDTSGDGIAGSFIGHRGSLPRNFR